MAFSAALTRHLWQALNARTTLLFNDLAYRLLRVGTGSTPCASAEFDLDLRQGFRQTVQFCDGEQVGTLAEFGVTKFAQALKVDFRGVLQEIPNDVAVPLSAGSALADFYTSLTRHDFSADEHSEPYGNRLRTICGLYKFRSRHDEQPFLRSLRHPPCVVGEA